MGHDTIRSNPKNPKRSKSAQDAKERCRMDFAHRGQVADGAATFNRQLIGDFKIGRETDHPRDLESPYEEVERWAILFEVGRRHDRSHKLDGSFEAFA